MSLKLVFVNNSSPFFLPARLCLERFSELQPSSFKTSLVTTLHIPKCAICQPLQHLSSPMESLHHSHLVPPSKTISLLTATPPLTEITENTLGSSWIEHTQKVTFVTPHRDSSCKLEVMLSCIYESAAKSQLQ